MQSESQVFVREAIVTYRRAGGVRVPIESHVADSTVAASLLRRVIPDGPAEHFVVVALDTRGYPQAWTTIAIGGLDACPVESSAVLRFVLLAGAKRFICGHNHPSGRALPSADDIALTGKLKRAAETVGLELVDHVVVTHDSHSSLRDSGLL